MSSMSQRPGGDGERQIAKICGADIELGNFITGDSRLRTPREAAESLLAEFEGVPGRAPILLDLFGNWRSDDPQDRGRLFLPGNGGCVYIDLDHLELCLPEVSNAYDHLACWHAMLRLARRALVRANQRLNRGRVRVLVNNSDGLGASYGSHLDVLMTRRAWDAMFGGKLQYLLFLGAWQASAIVFAGQGKVGSENSDGPVAFQISQRADFIETLAGPQTTFRRPLVNTRDEPLCAGSADLARLHVICFDSTLCHAAHLLTVGGLQIILSMIEAEDLSAALLLDDPVGAIRRWSRDPGLEHRERLVSGGRVTAVEHQQMFVEHARRFVDRGACEGVVPRARELLALWEDTIGALAAEDWPRLTGRLDWVLKQAILSSVLDGQPGLSWASPEIKHLDHVFSSLDADEGLFWAYDHAGAVEQFVSDAVIDRFIDEPPSDTRAWLRTRLLRHAGADAISGVDWDAVHLRETRGRWSTSRRIDLADPRVGRDAADLDLRVADATGVSHETS